MKRNPDGSLRFDVCMSLSMGFAAAILLSMVFLLVTGCGWFVVAMIAVYVGMFHSNTLALCAQDLPKKG